MSRFQRFVCWCGDAQTLKRVNGWLAVIWLGFGLAGLILDGVRESIPVLFFISVYANVAGHWSAWQASRTEVKQDDAAA